MTKSKPGLSSFTLHIIAMTAMLIDHMYHSVMAGNHLWMNCVGRIAFPIFAFMIAEGFHHTKSVPKYLLRMLIFALLSEVPFNLMLGGDWRYPYHQNVMWTFLVALLCLWATDAVNKLNIPLLTAIATGFITFGGFLLATAMLTDYHGWGVVMVMVFYTFREKNWQNLLAQAIGIFYINWIALGGMHVPVNLGFTEMLLPVQGLAVLALPFIWLYNGTQGPHNKVIQICFYAFYPVHLLILGLIVYFA